MEEWLSIFQEADEIGVSYILLAGGEPLLSDGEEFRIFYKTEKDVLDYSMD